MSKNNDEYLKKEYMEALMRFDRDKMV